MKKIRFGMVGLGKISHRFIRGLQLVEDGEVIAVASRTKEKADSYAALYQIPYAYASYEEMLRNPKIDAIYIATPNDTHQEYMMKAIQYGKHVLCEKPFCVHTDEAKQVFAYAKQQHVLVMEAMKACFLPTTKMVKQWLAEDKIGKLHYIEAGYTYQAEGIPKTHHLYDLKRGGGSFYDVGIYPLAFVNEVHKEKVEQVVSQSVYERDIDIFTQALIQYQDGVVASIRSGIFAKMENTAVLYGEYGSIHVPQFWKSERAYLRVNGEAEVVFEEIHHASEFQYQIRHFVALLQTGQLESPIMSAQTIIDNLHILEGAIFHE